MAPVSRDDLDGEPRMSDVTVADDRKISLRRQFSESTQPTTTTTTTLNSNPDQPSKPPILLHRTHKSKCKWCGKYFENPNEDDDLFRDVALKEHIATVHPHIVKFVPGNRVAGHASNLQGIIDHQDDNEIVSEVAAEHDGVDDDDDVENVENYNTHEAGGHDAEGDVATSTNDEVHPDVDDEDRQEVDGDHPEVDEEVQGNVQEEEEEEGEEIAAPPIRLDDFSIEQATASVEKRAHKLWNIHDVRKFSSNYQNEAKELENSWDLVFRVANRGKKRDFVKSLDRPAPYRKSRVAKGEFLETTPVEEFLSQLRDPELRSPDELYAITANVAHTVKVWQDEYLAIDNLTKLATRKASKQTANPRRIEQHEVFEDKKEAMLYGYKHDPKADKVNNQDPFIQGGFKPTPAQFRKMSAKIGPDNLNPDGWRSISRFGIEHIPRYQEPPPEEFIGKQTRKRKAAELEQAAKKAANEAATHDNTTAAAAAAATTTSSTPETTTRINIETEQGPNNPPAGPLLPKRTVIRTRSRGGRQAANATSSSSSSSSTKTTTATSTDNNNTTTNKSDNRKNRNTAATTTTATASAAATTDTKPLSESLSLGSTLIPTRGLGRGRGRGRGRGGRGRGAPTVASRAVPKTGTGTPQPAPPAPAPPADSRASGRDRTTTATATTIATDTATTAPTVSTQGSPFTFDGTSTTPATLQALPPLAATTASALSQPALIAPAPIAPQESRSSVASNNMGDVPDESLDPAELMRRQKIANSKNPKRTEAMLNHWERFIASGRIRKAKRSKEEIEASRADEEARRAAEGPKAGGGRKRKSVDNVLTQAATKTPKTETTVPPPPPPPAQPPSVGPAIVQPAPVRSAAAVQPAAAQPIALQSGHQQQAPVHTPLNTRTDRFPNTTTTPHPHHSAVPQMPIQTSHVPAASSQASPVQASPIQAAPVQPALVQPPHAHAQSIPPASVQPTHFQPSPTALQPAHQLVSQPTPHPASLFSHLIPNSLPPSLSPYTPMDPRVVGHRPYDSPYSSGPQGHAHIPSFPPPNQQQQLFQQQQQQQQYQTAYPSYPDYYFRYGHPSLHAPGPGLPHGNSRQ